MYTGTVDDAGEGKAGRMATMQDFDGAEGAQDFEDEDEDEEGDTAVRRMHEEVEGEEEADP